MPKSITIEPEQAFARDTIHLSDIQINAYQKSLAEEVAAHSAEDLSGHVAGHVRHPRIRIHIAGTQDQRYVQRHYLQSCRPSPSFHRTGSGGGGDGVFADAGRPHLWFSP